MMIRDDAQWPALIEAFYAAALGENGGDGWYNAIDAFARATGSSVGELVCIGPDVATPVNLFTNVDPGLYDALEAAGGLDPAFNPRIAAGLRTPVLQSIADADFITPDEIRHHPHYQEFLIPCDLPFICASVLERTEGMMIGVAVLRTTREGHVGAAEREVFEALAPHIRTAVRMQLALENQGETLLAGALEALTVPAFVCDAAGRVRALTPAAEDLVRSNRGLVLRRGQLLAANPIDARPLKESIDTAVQSSRVPGSPPAPAVVMHDASGAPSLVVDVIPLPQTSAGFSFTARVLVVARGERGPTAQRAVLLQRVFALTAAEADIAIRVAEGHSTEEIAAARGVAVGTVRSQIKAIMAKLGVRRQAELAVRVNRF